MRQLERGSLARTPTLAPSRALDLGGDPAGNWTETATFMLMAEVSGLRSWRNRDRGDVLVIAVPAVHPSDLFG